MSRSLLGALVGCCLATFSVGLLSALPPGHALPPGDPIVGEPIAGEPIAGEAIAGEAIPPQASATDDGLIHVCIEEGKKRPVIDGIGWVIGIPRKLLLWDHRADNHHVSDGTVAEITNYLEDRGLDDTVVRVNQYAPLKEWNRLVQNRKVGPGWRYTIGTLHLIKYTVLPGRIFGHDEYNPYSDSLYVYSDMPSLGLVEAAYAKDVQGRNLPGTYAAIQDLPGVALWHETLATREVITYVRIHGSKEEIEKVRHDLYARYGMETAGVVGQFAPDGAGLFTVVGAVGGHAVAAGQNSRTER